MQELNGDSLKNRAKALKAKLKEKMQAKMATHPHYFNKPMLWMLLILGILFGLIFGYKIFTGLMIKKFMSSQGAPVMTVAVMKATSQPWQPVIKATGSLRAVKGVDVTTSLSGMVQTIFFTPGQEVKLNDVLVKLNDDAEVAQLHSLMAAAELAQVVYDRDKAQYAIQAISKATLDSDLASLKGKQADVAQQTAIVAKKTIQAPFDGRLGISYVNPGQFLNPGDKVVTLQALDPIYVDFTLPQQDLIHVHVGQDVRLVSDAHPGRVFTGKISTIDPKIDPATRNIQLEATVANPDHALLPGLFGKLEVTTGAPNSYLTLPQTAVSFNPYGEIIYIVEENGKDKTGSIRTVKQTFVTTGDMRGDQVAILKGLKEGEIVVISGQQKLKNGSRVAINNTILPSNEKSPNPVNE